MGRSAGWLALYSGVAGGADIILMPEMPYDLEAVVKVLRMRNKKGKRYSIIVIAEGAKPKGGEVVARKVHNDGSDAVRFGGVGFVLAENITKMTGLDARTVVMGHLMRGGSPTPFDRVLGTQFGVSAVDLINKKKLGHMVGVKGSRFVDVKLDIVAKGSRKVPKNHMLINQAISLGTSFGINMDAK